MPWSRMHFCRRAWRMQFCLKICPPPRHGECIFAPKFVFHWGMEDAYLPKNLSSTEAWRMHFFP